MNAPSQPRPRRRTDPARLWYGLAGSALAVLAILHLSGLLDLIGP